MFGSLFRRTSAPLIADEERLGRDVLATEAPLGAWVPDGCVAVVIERGGRQRIAAGERIAAADGATAWCLHPGPYECVLGIGGAQPGLGLQLRFAIDGIDARASHQRFDLFLASEAAASVTLAGFAARVAATLAQELRRTSLVLPNGASLAQWQAFRAGLDQLLYARYGVQVLECMQVDVASATPPVQAGPATLEQAWRRLVLELPCLICAVRQAVLPAAQEQFRQQQGLLLRLDQVSLALSRTPGAQLPDPGVAAEALDAAWALLARLTVVGEAPLDALFAEAERIVATLEGMVPDLANV